jgi:hypothetical protein
LEPDTQQVQQPQPLYQPVSIEQITTYDKDHTPIPGVRVHFYVVGGGDQYVDVPEHEFNVKNVQKAIHAKAVEIAKVLSIMGPDVHQDENGRPIPLGE